MEENKEKTWCVYKHTSPSGKVYIGITCKNPPELRWSNGNGYKRNHPYFWNAIQKYGWENFEREIMFNGLSRDEACNKEQELIELYDATNSEKGYNKTKGGDGKLGYIMSEETKHKISQSHIGKFVGEDNPNYGNHKIAGENNPFYGKSHSEETKNKLREIATGRTSYMKGKHFTGEALDHIIKARKKECKPLLQFNESGEFLSKFENAADAADVVQGNRNTISACCRGEINTAYGYIWIYEEDYDPTVPICKKQRKQRGLEAYSSKVTLQYTVDNILIKEFISASEASRQTKINVCSIRSCCEGKQKSAGGFIWRYKENESN